jgi:hypothetical protein
MLKRTLEQNVIVESDDRVVRRKAFCEPIVSVGKAICRGSSIVNDLADSPSYHELRFVALLAPGAGLFNALYMN